MQRTGSRWEQRADSVLLFAQGRKRFSLWLAAREDQRRQPEKAREHTGSLTMPNREEESGTPRAHPEAAETPYAAALGRNPTPGGAPRAHQEGAETPHGEEPRGPTEQSKPGRFDALYGWLWLALCLAVVAGVGYYNGWLPGDSEPPSTDDPGAAVDWASHLGLSEDGKPPSTDDRTEFSAGLGEGDGGGRDMPDTIQAAELSSRSKTEVAAGRCAPTIVLGVYDWEFCAWFGVPDSEMSRPDMRILIERVWRETDTPGKPKLPPELEEGSCGWLADVAGCYVPVSHSIVLVSGRAENFTLRLLLHELAHALIADSAEMASCADDWSHRQSACGHGNLFRCVADDLYVRYAGLDTAGVCGQAPDLDPGDWQLLAPDEYEWGVVHHAAQVTDPESNHKLQIICATNYEQLGESQRQLETILFLDHGWNPYRRSGRRMAAEPDYRVRIRYRFSNEEHQSDSRWLTDESLTIAIWPEHDASSLARRFQGADRLFLRIEYTQQDIVQVEFDLGDSPALAMTQETCK